jgi:putative transposase
MSLSLSTRKKWVEPCAEYSIRRQCRLAGVSISAHYYESAVASKKNILLMRLIDE